MSAQTTLDLAPNAGRPMPPHNWRETSREAARRIVEHAGRLERAYLMALHEAGEAGLIDHEAKRKIKCALTTVQPRRADLNEHADAPLVEPGEHKRDSPTGRPCIAWVLTDLGRETAERLTSTEGEHDG